MIPMSINNLSRQSQAKADELSTINRRLLL
jgi:hypothetical protein